MKEWEIKAGQLVHYSADCWTGDCEENPKVGIVLSVTYSSSAKFLRPYSVLWHNGKTENHWKHDLIGVEYYRERKKSLTGYDINC